VFLVLIIIYLGGNVRSCDNSMFKFWGTANSFSLSVSFYSLTNNVWRFWFLHILANTCSVSIFLVLAILECVKWYLVVLICDSLMTNDVEHFFMCLLAICVWFLEICLFTPFSRFISARSLWMLLRLALVSQVAETSGVCHRAWFSLPIFKLMYSVIKWCIWKCHPLLHISVS
jgi:hypothetical protein